MPGMSYALSHSDLNITEWWQGAIILFLLVCVIISFGYLIVLLVKDFILGIKEKRDKKKRK